jgi:hypothetical protein
MERPILDLLFFFILLGVVNEQFNQKHPAGLRGDLGRAPGLQILFTRESHAAQGSLTSLANRGAVTVVTAANDCHVIVFGANVTDHFDQTRLFAFGA